MNTLKINIVRKKQFYGLLMPITVSVFDKETNLICRKRIMSWKPVSMLLPKKDYIITFSNKMLLARTVSSSVTVNGAAADEVRIDIEISHIHWLYMAIPFLGFLTPLFDYRISTIYQKENEKMQETKKRKVNLSALPFLLLAVFSIYVLIGIWMDQLYLPDIEIERWELEGTDAYTEYTYELLGSIAGTALMLPIFILLSVLALLLVRRANQKKRRGERKPVDENAPEILYLRPFGDDKFTAKEVNMFLRPGVSEEEALVSVLDDIAPVLCVGRPGNKYLPDGAARIAIPGDTWKEKVAELAQKAELIVLRLGKTDGVLWELQYCLEKLDRRKLVLILPDFESEADWVRVRDMLIWQGVDNIYSFWETRRKNKGSIQGFLYFDEYGQAVYRPLKISRMEAWLVPLEDKIKEALGDVCAKFGLRVKKRKGRPAIIAFCVFYVLFTAIILLNSYLTFKIVEHGRFPQDLAEAGRNMENVGETIDGWNSKAQTDYLFVLFLNGLMFQEDENIEALYAWEAGLMNCINSREYELLMENADGYPIRYLTLAKKYCSDEEYGKFIEYLKQCIELFQINQGETPQVRRLDGEARTALTAVLEELPLYSKENLSLEEQLILERQFHEAVLELQAEGYDMIPVMRSEFSAIGLELYNAATSSE